METKVVVSAAPAKYTVAPLAKPVPLIAIVALPGFTGLGVAEVTTGCGFWRIAVTLALAVASAWLIAVMVTEGGFGRMAGAVYVPVAVIVPTLVLPPVIAFTCQATTWSDPMPVIENDPSPNRILIPNHTARKASTRGSRSTPVSGIAGTR